MALFRRGSRETPAPDLPGEDAAVPAEEAETAAAQRDAAEAEAEAAPRVSISVSTYGGPVAPASAGRPASVSESASAPASPEPAAGQQPPAARPGMPDNALAKAALQAFPEDPAPADVMNVMRQVLQGILYVRVKGDARALLAAGDDLSFAASVIRDQRYLLAYTGPEALQASVRADGDTATSALGQPVQTVLRHVVAGSYAGLILDPAVAGSRIILPTPLIARALDEGDAELTLKNLIVRERTAETIAAIADALTRAPLWLAVNTPAGNDRVGVSEARNTQGERRVEVFSHPLEVVALGRGDRPVPVSGAQLAGLLATNPGVVGIVLDPAGPWITLDRPDLTALLALADPE